MTGDASYLEAVRRGDMRTAQRMVDEAAKRAGRRNESGAIVNLETGAVISESHAGAPIEQNWQDNVTFNEAGIAAITTGDIPVAITHTHPDESGLSDSDMRMLGWSNVKKVQAVTPSGTVYTITKPEGLSTYPRKIQDTWNNIEDEIFESGRSLEMSVPQIIREINIRVSNELGFIYSESENQLHPLKLESIIRDDAGNVIPLSQRFRSGSPDIRNPKTRKGHPPQFPYDYAAYLKRHFPSIWRRGGNIRGNDTFRWWTAWRRGDRSPTVMRWWEVTRPAWIARHYRDHRLPGVIAQIKWGTVGVLGVAGMKRVVEDAIRKGL